mgnify:CR=1 FL=1
MLQEDKLKNTKELMELVKTSPKLFGDIMLNPEVSDYVTLQDYLQSLLDKHGFSVTDVVRISLLSKSYVYQIFSGDRMPSRDSVIRIGLAMNCDIDEIQHMLVLAQTGILYPKVRRDAAILCCISQGFHLIDTNDFLESIEERSLI